MKDSQDVYAIWAPEHVLWTQWAKPVLFANLSFPSVDTLTIPTLKWIRDSNRNTMVIVDLPGKDGVAEALALAYIGYRPVPLYNGVKGPDGAMIVDVKPLQQALQAGASILKEISIREDAPPAFILDYRRMSGNGKELGKYDNRWCVFAQDMPSASFLLRSGIGIIIVRSSEIQADLSHVLYRYQNQGIKIILSDDDGFTRELTIVRPTRFKSLVYRCQVILGLKRNATGGFGGRIPDPYEHSAGTGYHGIG